MYSWQRNTRFTSHLRDGQPVTLNKEWSTYAYLQQEYGHLFPCVVERGGNDVVLLSTRKGKYSFARQCLQAA